MIEIDLRFLDDLTYDVPAAFTVTGAFLVLTLSFLTYQLRPWSGFRP